MKITYVVTECRDKVSAACTKTFNREVKRGRPQINCDACKAHKTPIKAVVADSGVAVPVNTERDCPCGNKFHIRLGRGRKATKCDECRASGTVYRADEDGELQAIRAETLAEEAREKAEEAGRERAERLVLMMQPLLLRAERKVIVH